MTRAFGRRPPVADIVAIAIALIAVVLFTVQVALPASTRLTNGFSAYDTAARLVVEGAEPSRFYDDTWFRAQTIRLGFAAAQDIYNVNPPPAALLLILLGDLPPVAAKEVWTLLNLVFVIVAVAVLARICRWSLMAMCLAIALLTFFEPLREEIRLGQAYALLLLLEALLAWAYLERRDRWVGGLLGALIGFKAAALAVPWLLIAQRRWRAAIALAVALLGIVTLTAPFLGWAAWSTYFRLLFDIGGHPEIAVTAYQSVPGILFHLFRLDPVWNSSPVADLPRVAPVIVIVAETILVAVTFVATSRAKSTSRSVRSLAFSAWAIVSIVASPASADYHYTLLIVPIALLVDQWWQVDRGWLGLAAIGLAVALVGTPIPYKNPSLAVDWWALLAYPKLYGGLLLLALALLELRADRDVGGTVAEWSPPTA